MMGRMADHPLRLQASPPQLRPGDPGVHLQSAHAAGSNLGVYMIGSAGPTAGVIDVLEFAAGLLEPLSGYQFDPLSRVPEKVSRAPEAAREAIAAMRRVIETGLVVAPAGSVPAAPAS
jgi:hypothetical protein